MTPTDPAPFAPPHQHPPQANAQDRRLGRRASRRRLLSAGALGASATALGAARLAWADVHGQELSPPAGSASPPPEGPSALVSPATSDAAASNPLRIPPLLS